MKLSKPCHYRRTITQGGPCGAPGIDEDVTESYFCADHAPEMLLDDMDYLRTLLSRVAAGGRRIAREFPVGAVRQFEQVRGSIELLKLHMEALTITCEAEPALKPAAAR